jgi:hypothetical protein
MDPVRGLVTWLQASWPVIRAARAQFDLRRKTVAADVGLDPSSKNSGRKDQGPPRR